VGISSRALRCRSRCGGSNERSGRDCSVPRLKSPLPLRARAGKRGRWAGVLNGCGGTERQLIYEGLVLTNRPLFRQRRRKGERLFALDWNPLVRRLEQAPCEYSYTWERAREVCDEALHLVSPAGHGPCAQCGRAFCRACHPVKCPKCGTGLGCFEFV
jgi:hypothetical protein